MSPAAGGPRLQLVPKRGGQGPAGPGGSGGPPPGPGAWINRLIWTKQGIKSCVHNALLVLQNDPVWKGCFAYDDFAQRTVLMRDLPALDYFREGPAVTIPDPHASTRRNVTASRQFAGIKEIDDQDCTRIVAWLEATDLKLSISSGMITEVVNLIAQTRKIHPVRDYLLALQWDGVPRIGAMPTEDRPEGTPGWLTTFFGARDAEYTRKVSQWWMISAVARVMQPGCQADHMIILEGGQGKGKSQGLRALAEPWYSEDLDLTDIPRAQQMLAGKWVLGLDELDGMGRQTVEAAKKFFTQPWDRYRQPYGRHARDYPRQCVFVGTTNSEGGYLRDVSGNRRYWPVATNEIDVEKVRAFRDQLWAEAVVLYRAGNFWHPQAGDADILRPEQDQRLDEDPWTEAVLKYADQRWNRLVPWDDESNIITGSELLADALKLEKSRWNKAEYMRVGKILTAAGWSKDRLMRHGGRVYCYRPPQTGGTVAGVQVAEKRPVPGAATEAPAELYIPGLGMNPDDDGDDFDRLRQQLVQQLGPLQHLGRHDVDERLLAGLLGEEPGQIARLGQVLLREAQARRVTGQLVERESLGELALQGLRIRAERVVRHAPQSTRSCAVPTRAPDAPVAESLGAPRRAIRPRIRRRRSSRRGTSDARAALGSCIPGSGRPARRPCCRSWRSRRRGTPSCSAAASHRSADGNARAAHRAPSAAPARPGPSRPANAAPPCGSRHRPLPEAGADRGTPSARSSVAPNGARRSRL